jgi:signal transduction histidine kinase
MKPRFILLFAMIQMFLAGVLVFWWGRLIIIERPDYLRMIIAEGVWFFLILVVCSIALVFFYRREFSSKKAVENFLASWTHELKTPLASIRLQAETIEDKNPGSVHVKRLLEDISRLELQVSRALELARVEGGGRLFCQPLIAQDLIECTLRAINIPDWVVIEKKLEGQSLKADPMAFEMILKNIIENAIVHANTKPLEIVIEEQLLSDGRVEIRVKDNGEGSENLNFGEIFVKSARSKGAGVGLYLVSRLMKTMGGDVAIKPRNGFCVSLRFAT